MKLADYSVLPRNLFLDDVYEPAEDTFILVDALERDLPLLKSLKPSVCLEIGSGSGVVITTIGKVLGPALYLTTDLNPVAALATRSTSLHNNVPVDAVVTDLANVFEPRLERSIDLIICNPPYAVTPNDEVGRDNLEKATSGGTKGRLVINRLLFLIPKLLSQEGFFYLVAIKENDIDDISNCFAAEGLEMKIILQRRSGIEFLYTLRFHFKGL